MGRTTGETQDQDSSFIHSWEAVSSTFFSPFSIPLHRWMTQFPRIPALPALLLPHHLLLLLLLVSGWSTTILHCIYPPPPPSASEMLHSDKLQQLPHPSAARDTLNPSTQSGEIDLTWISSGSLINRADIPKPGGDNKTRKEMKGHEIVFFFWFSRRMLCFGSVCTFSFALLPLCPRQSMK